MIFQNVDEFLSQMTEWPIKKKYFSLVATGGVFDLIQEGHVKCLQMAKKLGDYLVVLLNTDESVRKNRGPKRPIKSQKQRSIILDALECVDFVIFFNETTPIEALDKLRCDKWVKGGDYDIETLPEREVVEKYGGEIIIFPRIGMLSTTNIIEKILETHKDDICAKCNYKNRALIPRFPYEA